MAPRPELVHRASPTAAEDAAYIAPTVSADDAKALSSIPDSIDRLNAEVARKMKQPAMAALAGPEAVAAVAGGATVYVHRSQAAVALYLAVAAWGFYHAPSPAYLAGALALQWLSVDFFGAVLHVVLDTAAFVSYPLIGAGCLEFQWHHAIPHDIVTKPFVEVCGDLNYVILLHLAWHMAIFGLHDSAANCMGAARVVMAYAGQWAHRQAHTPAPARGPVTRVAQAAGLLVSPALHKAHHTNYDGAFPILNGWCAPIIAAMNAAVPNRHVWLVLFVALCLSDTWMCTKAFTAGLAAAKGELLARGFGAVAAYF